MYRCLLIPFVVFLNAGTAGDTYKKYCNARFDFCIEYPASFIAQPPAENGDGQIFLSKDGRTEVRAFGSLATEDVGMLEQEFTMASSKTTLTYKRITKDWFVFSGVNQQGKIVYRKTVKKKIDYMGQPGTETFQTIMITYPSSENKVYAAYCGKIAQSLK